MMRAFYVIKSSSYFYFKRASLIINALHSNNTIVLFLLQFLTIYTYNILGNVFDNAQNAPLYYYTFRINLITICPHRLAICTNFFTSQLSSSRSIQAP